MYLVWLCGEVMESVLLYTTLADIIRES
jgi:hypothetical protein